MTNAVDRNGSVDGDKDSFGNFTSEIHTYMVMNALVISRKKPESVTPQFYVDEKERVERVMEWCEARGLKGGFEYIILMNRYVVLPNDEDRLACMLTFGLKVYT